MSPGYGNLQPAHSGYRYQDIATAYVLARAVVERYDEVVVDRKQVDDDQIDDLEVRAAGRRLRRQFKFSKNADRALGENDFVAQRSSLRIDRLVLSQVRAGAFAADEYRLCATWRPPLADDALAPMLEPVQSSATIDSSKVHFFRLRVESIWPSGSPPLWAPLLEYAQAGAEFGRADVVHFLERFVIELSLPLASQTLTEPGPLESALTAELTGRIGIGRYPNHGREPSDVAALAISLANLARTQAASLTPTDIERDLGIRTDFGRVAQAFPLDESFYYDRPTFRRGLRDATRTGNHQLVVAPPGGGKSWELTRLRDELLEEGAIVARHYCYLEPGDELIERRITTDVFFGNLLADLIDAAPELAGSAEARYAAGIAELEATLRKAAALGPPIVLIVDGLDHIARVRAEAPAVADDETDIVEHLATLDVPPGVALVVGSQPGRHLDPLRSRWGVDLHEREVPRWSTDDLVGLFNRHNVAAALAEAGITDAEPLHGLLESLADRADGNPLYAHYLARAITSELKAGTIADPRDWIADAPAIGGDIAVYYGHLYRAASAEAQAVADVLGVIEFSVAEAHLREILQGPLEGWVPRALQVLEPVLIASSGQGGVRVFHESFRRFMTQELARQGRSIADALAPVISWLQQRGFFRDARAYRFLLPALRRAGRGADVLAHVGITFVSESVAQVHPKEAVERNLAIAADTAARARDWPALVRCVELHRSAYSCYDEGQINWPDYWTTYQQLFGPDALAERLLFDGRPTQTRASGLAACSLIDDAGGVAPWQEYLDLPRASGSESLDHFDEDGGLNGWELDTIVEIHGMLRIGEGKRVVGWLGRFLHRRGDNFKALFVRAIAARIARTAHMELVEELAQLAEPLEDRPAGLTKRAAAVLRLGLADEHLRRGHLDKAAQAATEALEDADSPELAAECVVLGAPPELALRHVIDPTSIPIAVGPDEYIHAAAGVRRWVATIRLVAADPTVAAAVFGRERQRIDGIGWYRCWLAFVIDLAVTETDRRQGQDGDVIGAFRQLARDVHPFRGKPRAMDLYAIRRVIQETLAWGLSLLRNPTEWSESLELLSRVVEGTGSRLDREDGGPIATGTLLDVLTPYVTSPIGGPFVRNLFEREVERQDGIGTYYSTHADFAMRLARARHSGGDIDRARAAWALAGVYLAAYGFRKDVTVYEVIESAPALTGVSRSAALNALVDSQRLTEAVIAHTDGRSTKQAPNAWLRSLLRVDSVSGMWVLAQTIVRDEGGGGWINARAIEDVAEQVGADGDPRLIDAVLATLRFEIEYDNEGAEKADLRLAQVRGMARASNELASRAIRRLAAEVDGDATRHQDAAAERIAAGAAEIGLRVPRFSRAGSAPPTSSSPSPAPTTSHPERFLEHHPAFPPDPSFVELLSGLRRAARAAHWNDHHAWDRVILALGYHLDALIVAGKEEEVVRLLRFFARDVDVGLSGAEHPLGQLATALDSAGHSRAAAAAYALAYSATRGGGGWVRFGGETHRHLVDRAVALDESVAKQTLADEVAYSLRGAWYSAGVARHLVERLSDWGDPAITERAWREAFVVIAHRLPLAPVGGWFVHLDPTALPEWTIDECLVALLLAKLADPRLIYKRRALAGFVLAVRFLPSSVSKPLGWWISKDSSITSINLVFEALLSVEDEPFPISEALREALASYARCNLWGLSRMSTLLLERLNGSLAEPGRVVVPSAHGGTRLPAKRREALLAADFGRRMERLEELWPELTDLVPSRLHLLVDGVEAHKERMRDRYRLAHGRDGKSYPPAPVLRWETELFEVALQEELNGLSAHLWSAGEWSPETMDAALAMLLPDAAAHLALDASRGPRPEWPLPASLDSRNGPLPVLGDGDPDFEGWTRLAMVEHQFLTDPQKRYGPPVELVTYFAGAIAIALGTAIPSSAFPFQDGAATDWWSDATPPPTIPPRLPPGRVVRLVRITDWLGDDFLLVPPIGLRSYLELVPPTYGEPLRWQDQRGPAIVLRTWRVLNAEAFDGEPVQTEGTDLIARPDVVQRLTQLYSGRLLECAVVLRRTLSLDE